jgi:hypothetical protein
MRMHVLLSDLNFPKGVAVHKNEIYWTEVSTISKASLSDVANTRTVLIGELGGSDLSGPNILEFYQDHLYWGNTARNNMGCWPKRASVPFSSDSSDIGVKIPKFKRESDSASGSEEEDEDTRDNRDLDPIDKPTSVYPPYSRLVQQRAVHGLCFVPEHDWLLWLDWSRDCVTILTLNAEILYVSERVGMLFLFIPVSFNFFFLLV